jgi:hypothetical protein
VIGFAGRAGEVTIDGEHAASLCQVLPQSRLRRKRANPMHLLKARSTKPERPLPGQEQLQLL